LADARDGGWDLVITPVKRWFEVDVAGVWRYRDLVVLLFKRDFVSVYKQTILGPLWYVIQPILTTIAFTLIFNKIAQISTDQVPPFLFYMSGVVIWQFFASCMGKTSDTFVANAGIFSKVYFPRLVVPASVVLSNTVTFAIQFALLLAFFGYYSAAGANVSPGPEIILVLPLLLYIGLLGLGVGIVASSLTTKYRDLTFVIGFATQLWMYASPVVYPLSQIPERWLWVFMLNPMTAAVEAFRWLLFGQATLSWALVLANAALTAILIFGGILLFSRAEKTSMDTV
jgi:homopolymeric O-antigen transport system permease protein